MKYMSGTEGRGLWFIREWDRIDRFDRMDWIDRVNGVDWIVWLGLGEG